MRRGSRCAGSRGANAIETDTVLTRARSADGQAQRRADRVGPAATRADHPRVHAGSAGGREGRPRHAPRLPRSGRGPVVSCAREAGDRVRIRGRPAERRAAADPCAGSRHAMRSRPGPSESRALGDELVVARTETVAFSQAHSPSSPAVSAFPTPLSRTRARRRPSPSSRAVSRRTSSAVSRAPVPISTIFGSRPAGESFASTARRESSGSRCLSLVLAEAELLCERLAVAPLVLLDDVLSELDGSRRAMLAEVITRTAQTVVTATSAEALPSAPALSLAVTPGRVA